MKQLHFFVVAAVAIFMGLGFASCLGTGDNNGEQQVTRADLATVEFVGYMDMDYFFRLDTGEKLIPISGISNVSVLEGVKRIFIIYVFESIEEINEQALISDPTQREYHVSITYATNLEDNRNVANLSTHDTANLGDSLTTKYYAPIKSIDSLRIKDDYLTAWINYNMSGEKFHFFTLFRYRDDALRLGKNDAPDTLDVYLGHNVNGDSYYNTTSANLAQSNMGYAPLYFKAFNITSVIRNVSDEIDTSNLVLKVITRQTSTGNDTINVSYPVKYNF
ncbi:hypothetical protein EZS27_011663 [termite gut metagenome]|uniref:NigD-like C-terminal beta sandwich domain-containing protein n=1 Tax=termite gut metagenome TaxID=433724 RepID=A0A5J4S2Y2_9ZZZZ